MPQEFKALGRDREKGRGTARGGGGGSENHFTYAVTPERQNQRQTDENYEHFFPLLLPYLGFAVAPAPEVVGL